MFPQLLETCTQFIDTKKPPRIVVGVSGGMDSVLLLHALSQVCSKNKHTSLELAHVNYGLRGAESDGDESFVRDLAEKYQCRLHVKQAADVARAGESVQEWARRVRYDWFTSLLQPGDIVALAHHHDDLAENVLLRLSRGSRVAESLGMKVFKAPFWRPLLNASKAEISREVSGQSLPYREDSSNDKLYYGRNRIRHEVLPILEDMYPQAKQRLVGAVEDVRAVYDYVRELLQPYCGKSTLSRSWLNQLPLPVQREAVELYIEGLQGERRLLPETLYAQLAQVLMQDSISHWTMELPQGGLLELQDQVLSYKESHGTQSQARYAQYRDQILSGQLGLQLSQNARLEWQASHVLQNNETL